MKPSAQAWKQETLKKCELLLSLSSILLAHPGSRGGAGLQEFSAAPGSEVQNILGFVPRWHQWGPEGRVPSTGLSSAPPSPPPSPSQEIP